MSFNYIYFLRKLAQKAKNLNKPTDKAIQNLANENAQMAEQLGPIEVLMELYKELAYIVNMLNKDVRLISDFLEPLTYLTNKIGDWIERHQTHESLEDSSMRLQNLVNQQQNANQ